MKKYITIFFPKSPLINDLRFTLCNVKITTLQFEHKINYKTFESKITYTNQALVQ